MQISRVSGPKLKSTSNNPNSRMGFDPLPRVRVAYVRSAGACQRVTGADSGDGSELPGAGHEDGPPAAAARGTARWACRVVMEKMSHKCVFF